jgi:hypothetical protein
MKHMTYGQRATVLFDLLISCRLGKLDWDPTIIVTRVGVGVCAMLSRSRVAFSFPWFTPNAAELCVGCPVRPRPFCSPVVGAL